MDDGKSTIQGRSCSGYILNQFSMDENKVISNSYDKRRHVENDENIKE